MTDSKECPVCGSELKAEHELPNENIFQMFTCGHKRYLNSAGQVIEIERKCPFAHRIAIEQKKEIERLKAGIKWLSENLGWQGEEYSTIKVRQKLNQLLKDRTPESGEEAE